jgi:hypothetical protein
VTIFGVTRTDLTLQHVRAYLADADAELPLWDAKGRDPRRSWTATTSARDVRVRDSHEHGYLIVGGRHDGVSWLLDGVPVPGNDPPAWLHDVAEGRLRPVPGREGTRDSLGNNRARRPRSRARTVHASDAASRNRRQDHRTESPLRQLMWEATGKSRVAQAEGPWGPEQIRAGC